MLPEKKSWLHSEWITRQNYSSEFYLNFYGGAGIPFVVTIGRDDKVAKRLYDVFTANSLIRSEYIKRDRNQMVSRKTKFILWLFIAFILCILFWTE